ncbi:hypothetical protein OROGR_004996 [Orobanche gracilis]
MKQCSTKLKSERSWADLDLDLLGEIKKKLYYGDHVRFGGVCKNWLAAQHEKRAADVLPLLLLLYPDDGELMLMYWDKKLRKFSLTSYDWSQKLWVPLKSLGGRSLFLSEYFVYVDEINYYGVSPNKIYLQEHATCSVYSFDNDEVLESTSSGLRNWDGLHHLVACSLWVEPPDILPK